MISECKQESKCKFLMSSRAGAGVTFLGTGAGVKKSDSDHLWWHDKLIHLLQSGDVILNSGVQDPDFWVQSGRIFGLDIVSLLTGSGLSKWINVAMQKILIWNNSCMRENYDILKS